MLAFAMPFEIVSGPPFTYVPAFRLKIGVVAGGNVLKEG
jgi:hypothetical protein